MDGAGGRDHDTAGENQSSAPWDSRVRKRVQGGNSIEREWGGRSLVVSLRPRTERGSSQPMWLTSCWYKAAHGRSRGIRRENISLFGPCYISYLED